MNGREEFATNTMKKYLEAQEQENLDVPCKALIPTDLGTSSQLVRSALKEVQNDAATVNKSASKRGAVVTEQQPAKPARVAVYSEKSQPVGEQLPTQSVVEPAAAAALIPDVDARDPANALLMSNYVNHVFSYLRELEVKYPIARGYLSKSRVAPMMRTILVDWLVDVHIRFKLVPETLYITVAIVDRFLQVEKSIDRRNLQLVGLASMLIACKYEEIYAPDLAQFCHMSDNAYKRNDLVKMEIRILKALNFSLGRPFALQFLRRFTKVASSVKEEVHILHHTLAKYLMELTLTEYSCCHYLPSAVAAAALCLSFIVFDTKDTPVEVLWDATMAHYSGYKVEDIQPLMEHLSSLVLKSESSKFQAIRKKYNSEKFYNISTIHELRGPRLVSMAARRVQNL